MTESKTRDPVQEIREILSEEPELKGCLSPLEKKIVETLTEQD